MKYYFLLALSAVASAEMSPRQSKEPPIALPTAPIEGPKLNPPSEMPKPILFPKPQPAPEIPGVPKPPELPVLPQPPKLETKSDPSTLPAPILLPKPQQSTTMPVPDVRKPEILEPQPVPKRVGKGAGKEFFKEILGASSYEKRIHKARLEFLEEMLVFFKSQPNEKEHAKWFELLKPDELHEFVQLKYTAAYVEDIQSSYSFWYQDRAGFNSKEFIRLRTAWTRFAVSIEYYERHEDKMFFGRVLSDLKSLLSKPKKDITAETRLEIIKQVTYLELTGYPPSLLKNLKSKLAHLVMLD